MLRNLPTAEARSREARILMPTFRSFARNAYRGGLSEAQDVLGNCDAVEFINLVPSKQFLFRERCLKRLLYHDLSRSVIRINPGLKSVRLTKEYELFVLICPYWGDVLYANAIKGWRDHCRIGVCWIDELWAKDVKALKYCLPLLKKFDFVILGIPGTEEALSDMIGKRCHQIQAGVDLMRFSPLSNPPERVIDVYSVGRKMEGVHRALCNLSASKEIFYVFDTFENAGNIDTVDHREHRDMYANMAKRSRFFIVAPGKMNSLEETGGQPHAGIRYYEGAAAGSVLLGTAPDCEAFRRDFDWPHAVIDIEPNGSNIEEKLSRLVMEPEEILDISFRNAEQALLRHDWVYRWKEIYGIAGLEETGGMHLRVRQLQELAKIATEERTVAGTRSQRCQHT